MNKEVKKCKYSKYCGGCYFNNVSYDLQLKHKQKKAEKYLSKYNKVNKIIGSDNPYYYRNKIQVTFGYDDNKNIICGNFVPSTHIIVPINECFIADKKSLEIINYIKELIIKYHLSIFNENTLKGCIRHIQVRCSKLNEYMVIIVTGSKRINKIDLIIKDLLKKFNNIKTIVQNINHKHTSMVLSNQFNILYGKGYITDELCGLKFDLSYSSFYQVNKYQTEKLYNKALDLLDLKGSEVIIDAYCGIGTISLLLARKAKQVIGVEINSKAIKDAINNAKLNKIKNTYFVSDDAGHFMQKCLKDNIKIDTVVMDPPRSGADIKFLKSLVKLKPNTIIYISCGIESLDKNLSFLTKNKYQVDSINPVDMFPFTEHVETIVKMLRK